MREVEGDREMSYTAIRPGKGTFWYCEMLLMQWPGWGGGLFGWLRGKRSPYCNVSPHVADSDMTELRISTMREF